MQRGHIQMQKSGSRITYINTEAVSALGSICMHHEQPVGPDRASDTSVLLSYWLLQFSLKPLTVNGDECDLMPGWIFIIFFFTGPGMDFQCWLMCQD